MLAAAVDVVRSRGTDEPQRTTTTVFENRDALILQLSRLGVRGELFLYGDGCSAEVLELPSLERRNHESTCSPRGAVSPDRRLVAACAGDATRIFDTADGGVHNGVPGCSPAWRPDGVLTVAYEREVVRFRLPCRRGSACPVTLISQRELQRAARRHPTVPDVPVRLRALVDGIAWLSNTRAAVLMSIRIGGRLDSFGPLSAIAFFENGRATSDRPYLRDTGGRLDKSPHGTYVTKTPDVILRSDGSQVSLPPHVREGHDFAWTDDERFLAVATPFAVTILNVGSLERYDRIGAGVSSVTLPFGVTELAWR